MSKECRNCKYESVMAGDYPCNGCISYLRWTTPDVCEVRDVTEDCIEGEPSEDPKDVSPEEMWDAIRDSQVNPNKNWCKDFRESVDFLAQEINEKQEIKEEACRQVEGLREAINSKPDMVNQPPHYMTGKMECIDWMEAALTHDEFVGGLKWNIWKYTYRYKMKGGIEDLKKAEFYLNRLIKKESEHNDGE